MKVILLEDVKSLGKKGQIVNQFEAMFLSAAHTDEIIMETLDAVKLVL